MMFASQLNSIRIYLDSNVFLRFSWFSARGIGDQTVQLRDCWAACARVQAIR